MQTSNSRDYNKAITSNQAAYRVFKVEAKLSGAAMSNPEFAGLLNDNTQTLTVTVARDDGTGKTTAAYKNAVKVWAQDSATVTAPDLSTTTMTKAVKQLTSSFDTIGYAVMYVDGTDASVANLDAAVTIDVAVKATGVVE